MSQKSELTRKNRLLPQAATGKQFAKSALDAKSLRIANHSEPEAAGTLTAPEALSKVPRVLNESGDCDERSTLDRATSTTSRLIDWGVKAELEHATSLLRT